MILEFYYYICKTQLLKHNIMKNLTITTEHEGIKKTTLLKELENFLEEMYNVSPNVSVFITKVTYGVTDETCTLSKKDQESLETWYYSIR